MDPATAAGARNGGAHFAYLSNLVKHYGGDWAVGSSLSIADILVRHAALCARGGCVGGAGTHFMCLASVKRTQRLRSRQRGGGPQVHQCPPSCAAV